MLITTINEWKKITEELEENENPGTMNNPKSTAISRYNDNLEYFNKNKSKLDGLLTSDDKMEEKEEEAKEIINNNKYLSLYWSSIKTNKKAEDLENTLNNSPLSNDELEFYKDELSRWQEKMVSTKKELEETIKNDAEEIEDK